MTLDPAVAAVRRGVRLSLADVPAGSGAGAPPVLVACSGGADSLALLAATVFEAGTARQARQGARTPSSVVGVTVDHGLQDGSADRAQRVVAQMAALGATETVAVRVQVTTSGHGLEAAAREARYAVLEEVAQRTGAAAVLLGHTRDDQAETVLLGLARGSGGRSVAGMRRAFAPFRRPFLDLTRQQTEAACAAQGIVFWRDPHNEDPRFTRARVRHRVLPVLEDELGPGVAATLARTADQMREDMEALDVLGDEALAGAVTSGGLSVAVLTGQLPALRRRALRLAALTAGSPAAELFRVHVLAVEALVLDWHGQREIQLPGHVYVVRSGDTLRFRRRPVAG